MNHKFLRDSTSSRESTSEAPSEDSDMSVGQPAAAKTCWEWSFVTMLCRLKPVLQRIRQMFSVLYDMATSRQTEQASFPVTASSSQVRPPPPPPAPPPTSAGIDCTPTAPPKYAGDTRLTTSGQDLHTELVLSRVVGGAVSVKLKVGKVESS